MAINSQTGFAARPSVVYSTENVSGFPSGSAADHVIVLIPVSVWPGCAGVTWPITGSLSLTGISLSTAAPFNIWNFVVPAGNPTTPPNGADVTIFRGIGQYEEGYVEALRRQCVSVGVNSANRILPPNLCDRAINHHRFPRLQSHNAGLSNQAGELDCLHFGHGSLRTLVGAGSDHLDQRVERTDACKNPA